MPLPLLWIGAGLVGAALTADHLRDKAQKMTDDEERDRLRGIEPEPYRTGENNATKLPSDILTSNMHAKPVPGAIVCCSVFSAFDHTGIWIDDDLIVELHGTGLIKGVSVNRFLDDRSGSNVFVACDSLGEPLVVGDTAKRAGDEVMSYWDYDVFDNNCYRFTWQCITGDNRTVKDFAQFNDLLAKLHEKKVYWDKLDVDQ